MRPIRKLLLASALVGGAVLAGCGVQTLDGEPVASTPAAEADPVPAPPVAGSLGSELFAEGTTVRVELPGDEVNTITFRSDGIFTNRVHSVNEVVWGRWWVAGGKLCLRPNGATRSECWPYAAALQPGQTVTLTSDRGHSARITLISGTSASMAGCGTYGFVDRDGDGFVEADEWTAYRAGAYGAWDVNRDGRIDQTEFQNCWRGGGFYAPAYYDAAHWDRYWSAFDANNDGWLSADEYWSASTWARLDRNANGRIEADEWSWWD